MFSRSNKKIFIWILTIFRSYEEFDGVPIFRVITVPLFFSGVGLNVSNSNPTICINDLIQLHNRQQGDNLPSVSTEQIIARTVSEMEKLIEMFQSEGVEKFRQMYYERWLHR